MKEWRVPLWRWLKSALSNYAHPWAPLSWERYVILARTRKLTEDDLQFHRNLYDVSLADSEFPSILFLLPCKSKIKKKKESSMSGWVSQEWLYQFKGAFDWRYSGIRINGIASRVFFGGKFRKIYPKRFDRKRCWNSHLYSDSIKILVEFIF